MSKVAIAVIAGLGCLVLVVVAAVVLAVLFFLPVRADPDPVERPETGGPRSVEPPPAALTIDGGTQVAGVGTYCWSEPAGDSESVAVCADMIGIPTAQDPLVVDGSFTARLELPLDRAPETLRLEVLDVGAEDELEQMDGLRWWRPQPGEGRELPLERAPEFALDLDPGLYVLSVFARWSERGDVNYGFLVRVEG